MATFLLGAAAAFGAYKYFNMTDEEKEKMAATLKDKAGKLKDKAVAAEEKAADYFNDLKAKGKIDGSLFDTQFFADLIENYCKAEGVRYIDLHPPVQARYDKGEKLNFDADGHFNGPTSRIVGEYLYDALKPDRHTDSQ